MKRLQEHINIFLKRYRHGWILCYLLLYLPWFAYLEKTVTTRFHIIHMAVDDYIPFIEFFIVPYLLWFAYVAVAMMYFFFKDISDFYKLCFFLFTGMTVFLVISSLYPNGHYLRPSVFVRDNIFVTMVQWLYGADTSTNLFPSIHVYNSLGVHIAIMNSERLRGKKWIQIGSWVLMSSIVLSTMFLKQHSVFDVITAGIMAIVMYYAVYGINPQQNRGKACEEQLRQI